MRSLRRHVDNITSVDKIKNNGNIGFTNETQIKPSNSTCKKIKTYFLNIDFNNNGNKLNLAYGYKNNIAAWIKFDVNLVSILSFKKHAFAEYSF